MKQKTVVDNFARLISTIFVPPVLALFTFVYFSITFETLPEKRIFSILISSMLLFIVPIIFFFILRRQNRITDFDTTIKEQRILPYFFGIALMLIGITLSFIYQINKEIVFLWILYLVSSVFLLLITKSWKISAHALGVSIPFAIFSFHLQVIPTLVLFVVLLLVGWSRIRLTVHSIKQVVCGGILGCVIVYLMVFLDKLI